MGRERKDLGRQREKRGERRTTMVRGVGREEKREREKRGIARIGCWG